MLRWIRGNTRKNKVRNENIRLQVGIAPIENKLKENRLQWFDHIGRRSRAAPVRRMKQIDIAHDKRLKGKPNMT